MVAYNFRPHPLNTNWTTETQNRQRRDVKSWFLQLFISSGLITAPFPPQRQPSPGSRAYVPVLQGRVGAGAAAAAVAKLAASVSCHSR